MKVIIAGSRFLVNEEAWFERLDEFQEKLQRIAHIEITEVVCGMQRGADLIGKAWAESKNIPVKDFPADWDTYIKAAGPIRNKQMADYADEAIVIWDGESRGSKNMIETMKKLGKPVYEVKI